MRQTALDSSSNCFCCYIYTFHCDQEEEEDKSDSKQIAKAKFKAGCAKIQNHAEIEQR
jgi:hypothetical protein